MTARAIRSMLSLASSVTERALFGLGLLFMGRAGLSMLSLGVHTGGSAPAILAAAAVWVVAVALEVAAVGGVESAETFESVDNGASKLTTGTIALPLPLPFLVLGAFAAGGCTSLDVPWEARDRVAVMAFAAAGVFRDTHAGATSGHCAVASGFGVGDDCAATGFCCSDRDAPLPPKYAQKAPGFWAALGACCSIPDAPSAEGLAVEMTTCAC